MKNILFIIFVFLFNLYLELANAQEIQIPIDEEGKIEYIDSKLEQKLNLFTEYVNFREARLFQISNSLFVLEIYYRPQEKLFKKRLQFSLEEVSSFQQKVTARIKQQAPQAALDQSGRTKLIIGNMALSLGYYGWALPVALDFDGDGKLAVGLYMLTSSAGFFLPFSATKNIPVTNAASNLSFYGGTRGIVHGITLAYLFSKRPSDKSIIGAGMLVSIPEAISGFVIASRSNMSAGTAEVIGVGGDFGIGLGLGAAHLANFYEDNEQSAAAVTDSVRLRYPILLFNRLLVHLNPLKPGRFQQKSFLPSL